ncbi:MAG: S-layer homology domain-containing protein [Eubacteriales bacterium]
MKNIKIVLSAVCILILVLTYSALAVEDIFKDVPKTHWAYEAIQTLSQAGIVKGYPDGTFQPDINVLREQFAIVLVNTLKIPLNEKAPQTFSDIDYNHRSFLYVDAVRPFIPIPKGYTFNFYPDRAITREEVAETIVLALNLNKGQKPDSKYLASKFKDYQSISPEFRENVAIAVYNGILSGDSKSNFHGEAGLTRAELSTIMNFLFQRKAAMSVGLRPPRKPWTIDLIDFQRPDYDMVRDFPDFNETQSFFGSITSKVYDFSNSHLIVEHNTYSNGMNVEHKTVHVYVYEKDLNLFSVGDMIKFNYDRDNNILSYVFEYRINH